jgi:hypothetical protein
MSAHIASALEQDGRGANPETAASPDECVRVYQYIAQATCILSEKDTPEIPVIFLFNVVQ